MPKTTRPVKKNPEKDSVAEQPDSALKLFRHLWRRRNLIGRKIFCQWHFAVLVWDWFFCCLFSFNVWDIVLTGPILLLSEPMRLS